jgi:alpha-ketoglutarate-dependent taurine dioxygenase
MSSQYKLSQAADVITPLPLIIHPVAGLEPVGWVRDQREALEQQLNLHGALLLRGFGIDGVDKFRGLARAVVGELLEYDERSSPRHEQGDRVYTSTDYPPEHYIYLHNEHSYARRYPRKLLFCCLAKAEKGGRTPLADVRKVLGRIRPEIQRRFLEKKWMLVRNFGSKCGLSWQTTFQTSDRAVVEEYCRQNDIQWRWRPDGALSTSQVRPAIVVHPRTGERVWFNHATFFHISTLPKTFSKMFLSAFSEGDLPNNTYYGDGSAIEDETLDALRAAYQAETVAVDWQPGDVLIVDNMLVAHGREPYRGNRKVVVAMGDASELSAANDTTAAEKVTGAV